MPVTVFLTYDGGITSTGTAFADSEISVSVLQLLQSGDLGIQAAALPTYTQAQRKGHKQVRSLSRVALYCPQTVVSMFEVRPQQLGFA
jgi:hypothetical protein